MFMIIFEKEMAMKRIVIKSVCLLLLAVLLVSGCKKVSSSINGSGKLIDQELDIADFTNITATGVYNLTIVQSAEYQVTVTLDDNLFGRLIISKERKSLKLDIEAPATFFPTNLKVSISMPVLQGLNLSGGAKATIAGFVTPEEDFTLFMEDRGTLEGYLEVKNININMTDNTKATLEGNAFELDLQGFSGSELDMIKVALTRAKVKLDASRPPLMSKASWMSTSRISPVFIFSGRPVFNNTSVTGGSTMTMIQPTQ